MGKFLSNVKIKLAGQYPILARLSRFYKAFYQHLAGQKTSYAQHGEDVFIWQVLNTRFPGTTFNFLDVGGFHPMLLSNTYLLYRNNVRGVVVEPNPELILLHRIFRSKDIQLQIACGRENSLRQFFLRTTFPALSSLRRDGLQGNTRSQYVPLLNLDTIVDGLDMPRIYFLSVDVEGFDLAVIQGAEKTLQRTFLVCIEFNSAEEKEAITAIMQKHQFSFLKGFGCNLIFQNEKFEQYTVTGDPVLNS